MLSFRIQRIGLGVFVVGFLALHFYLKGEMKPFSQFKISEFHRVSESWNEEEIVEAKTLDLSEIAHSQKLTLLFFWEANCDLCQEEFTNLEKTYSKFTEEELEVVGFFQNSNPTLIQKIMAKTSMFFFMVRDSEGTFFKRFEIQEVPTTILINAKLEVVHRHSGTGKGLTPFVANYLKANKNTK